MAVSSLPGLFIFLLGLLHCRCHAFDLMNYSCNNGSSYAVNTTYHSNVRALLGSLAANASRSNVGFATAALGSAPDRVWGLALCRGDVNGTGCASCLALVPGVAFVECQGDKDVTVFYDRCLLRYSNKDFTASPDNNQVLIEGSSKDRVTLDAARFDDIVAALVARLSDWAAFNSTSRYAAGLAITNQGFTSTTDDVVHNVYGVAQCAPYQAPRACRDCLEALREYMPNVFNGSVGGWFNAVWCNLRYETFEFYDGNPVVKFVATPSTAPPSPAAPENRTGYRRRRPEIAAKVIAVVLGVVLIFVSVFSIYLWRKLQAKQYAKKDDSPGSLLFNLPTLIEATANFAEENKLGHGGFGAVYRGLLSDGREIAVKRLDKASNQGLKQLRNELLLVAKLRHNNLAKLLGVCLQGEEKLLVYEYLPNRSLDTFLFDTEKRAQLDWDTRFRIIYGTARGLLYLHEDSQIKIIHRDLKASNILLDAEMNPKISDFGLARLFNSEKTSTITSQVVGTLGYMAPEYAILGHLSVKLDVYSFGVLVLEIMTGRKNTDTFELVEDTSTLLSYVWDRWLKGTPLETVDPSLGGQAPESEVLKCIHLGLLCVQENPAGRPTMLSVLVMLHGEASSFATPSKPAFAFAYGEMSSNKSNVSGDPDNQAVFSANEVSMSEFHPR